MSSGGGSTTTQSTELPAWLQDAAKSNLGRADYVSQLGYVPQYGIDVAGFTPMQTSAMQNTADAASAFGLSAPTNAMAGMPAQQTNNLGFSGYSSGDLFNQSLANLAQQRPAQYAAMNSMFIDPMTGETPLEFGAHGLTFDQDAYDRMASGAVYNPLYSDSEGETVGVKLTPEQKYYGNLQMMDIAKNNPFAKASLLAQGLGALSNINATRYENDVLGWNEPPNANYPVNVINDSKDSDSASGPSVPMSVATGNVSIGSGGWDPSGTTGGLVF